MKKYGYCNNWLPIAAKLKALDNEEFKEKVLIIETILAISAVGYGEWRPVDSNKEEKGRARNRRVDIVIMNGKFNQIENNG